MSESKTHYRKVFKSDYLGVADLEDLEEEGKKRFIFTIKEVKQEFGINVAGRKGDHNVAYFVENIKPWIINASNGKIMRKFNNNSPFVEDWSNTIVELYIDRNVKLKGETVGGIKLHPEQPSLKKPELTPDMEQWSNAVNFLKEGNHIDKILGKYELSKENREQLLKEVTE